MHNIKDIRNNFENFKNQIKDRNFDANLDDLIELDEQNRSLIQDKEKFRTYVNKEIILIRGTDLRTDSREESPTTETTTAATNKVINAS